MYVIVVGNLESGIQSVFGPFEDKEHAQQFQAAWLPLEPCLIWKMGAPK